ncbi:MAG: bifunctional UDP-N-acetylglucosamine diphosphorylase/glucosamine-1-phosphate N-acetyltransferase GlmU [Deltaproteobacteria bacterium]|nr:bifunctional UDP-N-acetylglucosamine diphosphorylase/glucosamine-1-phosphate N-acetyltransferase GlmU [Deltaproteobacteria bacterium]
MITRTAQSPSSPSPLAIVVLAAGMGKRMLSDLPKALARTRENTLIDHVLITASKLDPERIVVVTGHMGDFVEEEVKLGVTNGSWSCKKLLFARQAEQLGTGDAVKSALPQLKDFVGTVLILCGDMPLVREESLRTLISLHQAENATVSLISLVTSQPAAYGRIIRDGSRVTQIVEARDCTPQQLSVNEINAAIYAVDSAFLEPALKELKNENAQKEYYLTDIVAKASGEGQTIAALVLHDEKEIQGVNTRYELGLVNRSLMERRIKRLMEEGVEILDPATVLIDETCTVHPGARIGPNVQLLGKTTIEAGVIIEGTALIFNTHIKSRSHIKIGVRMEDAQVGEGCAVGPFAHIRPGSVLGEEVKIGNFVETKKAVLSKGAKASHLTYLGDCSVGEDSNIGAGTITCNYDGYSKFETKIGRDVFIGSNSALVAPVTIDDGATVGAGSTITKNVEKDSLAFTRAPQLAKSGWSKNKREKAAKKK